MKVKGQEEYRELIGRIADEATRQNRRHHRNVGMMVFIPIGVFALTVVVLLIAGVL